MLIITSKHFISHKTSWSSLQGTIQSTQTNRLQGEERRGEERRGEERRGGRRRGEGGGEEGREESEGGEEKPQNELVVFARNHPEYTNKQVTRGGERRGEMLMY